MSINQQQTEFIEAHGGDLTPEQAAHLLEMGQGDTEGAPAAPLEQGGVPSVADDQTAGAPAKEQVASDPAGGKAAAAGVDPNAVEDPANTVILAKDGKHTIGYEKLVEAREEAKSWKHKAEQAQAALDAGKASAQPGAAETKVDTNAAAAAAAIDKGVDPAIFGDFSDEAIVKGIATLLDAKTGEILKLVEATVEAKLAPMQQSQAAKVSDAHFAAIHAKHPDLDSIVESTELAAWLAAQPSFAQKAYADVINQGTAQQVIELFDLFKQANGTQAAPALPSGSVKAAAAAAIAKAQSEHTVPTSLSDLPGGRPGSGATRDEAWAQMDGVALQEAMQDASPEQIEKFLNRRV